MRRTRPLGLVSAALRQALAAPQRPVALECALDVWGAGAEVAPAGTPVAAAPPPVDEDAVRDAARLLGAAARPIIVVGAGALAASDEVTAIAELLQAPVDRLSPRPRRGRQPQTRCR